MARMTPRTAVAIQRVQRLPDLLPPLGSRDLRSTSNLAISPEHSFSFRRWHFLRLLLLLLLLVVGAGIAVVLAAVEEVSIDLVVAAAVPAAVGAETGSLQIDPPADFAAVAAVDRQSLLPDLKKPKTEIPKVSSIASADAVAVPPEGRQRIPVLSLVVAEVRTCLPPYHHHRLLGFGCDCHCSAGHSSSSLATCQCTSWTGFRP